MSTYRNTERARHSDEAIMRVGPIARAVWDYLCCNQQDHASGLYRLSVAAACEDTGWTVEQFDAALDELEAQDLIERDPQVRLVWVRNMLRKSYPNPMSKQVTSVEKHLASMPRTDLVPRLVAYYAIRYDLHLTEPEKYVCEGASKPLRRVPSEIADSDGGSLSVSVSVSDSVSVSEGNAREQKPPKSKRRPLGSELEDDLPPGLVDEVLELLRSAVRDVTRGRDRGPLDVPGNRDLIRKCTRREAATLEHWRTVIAAQAASVRRDPDAWRYLALSTLTRRNNWLRLLDAPVGRSPPRGPIDPSQMDYESESPF